MTVARARSGGAEVHKRRGWIGAGFWRRKAVIPHVPRWSMLLSVGANGDRLEGCQGEPGCTEVRTVHALRTGLRASDLASW